MKHVLCQGRNNGLSYCDDDACDWAGYFTRRGDFVPGSYDFGGVELQIGREVTKARTRGRLTELLSNAKPGDLLVWTYSDHGTASGPNEGIVLDTVLWDYEIRDIIKEYLGAGVGFVGLFDTCNSGQMTRAENVKYMPPEKLNLPPPHRVRSRLVHADPSYAEIAIGACEPDENSIEDSGLQNGLFTYHAIETAESCPDCTYRQWTNAIDRITGRTQHPVAHGSDENLDKQIFSTEPEQQLISTFWGTALG